MINFFTNAVGYVAAVVGTCIMLPQLIKMAKTRRVGDISLGTIALYCLTCVLWTAYGSLIVSYPVIIANVLGLMIGIAQWVFKKKYE